MFLKFDVKDDALLLFVQTGPLEKYDPSEAVEVTELFDEVRKLDTEIKEMRAKIAPKLIEIKQKVDEFNQKRNKSED